MKLYETFIVRGQTHTYKIPIIEVELENVEEFITYFQAGNRTLTRGQGDEKNYFKNKEEAIQFKNNIINHHIKIIKKQLEELELCLEVLK